jgi:hypothetical protein
VQRRLVLRPACKKQQYAHLVDTEAQLQTVKFWKVKELHRRLHLLELDDMARSITLPKVHESTYRLLLRLTRAKVLPTAITSQGTRVVYPPWTKVWTRPEWDLDTSEESCRALLAGCPPPPQAGPPALKDGRPAVPAEVPQRPDGSVAARRMARPGERGVRAAHNLFRGETAGLLLEKESLDAVTSMLGPAQVVRELRKSYASMEERDEAAFEHMQHISQLLHKAIRDQVY